MTVQVSVSSPYFRPGYRSITDTATHDHSCRYELRREHGRDCCICNEAAAYGGQGAFRGWKGNEISRYLAFRQTYFSIEILCPSFSVASETIILRSCSLSAARTIYVFPHFALNSKLDNVSDRKSQKGRLRAQ